MSDTNVLSFLAAPDYEAPGDVGADNVYSVVITVSDGTDDVTQSLAITVTDVPSPAFTSASTLNVLEGGTSALTVTGGGSIALTGGPDLAKFTLSSANVLTFNVATDFETPGDSGADNVYNLTFTATEGTETSTLDLAITVTDAFEGRVIDGPVSGATVYIDVNGNYTQDADELRVLPILTACSLLRKECNHKFGVALISIGGTDTTTNKALPDLALVSDVPTAATALPISHRSRRLSQQRLLQRRKWRF